MSTSLLNQLSALHTTPLGVTRIKNNLSLATDDVVDWCRQQIKIAQQIGRRGKNWYVTTDQAIITINAHSLTIITAHPRRK